MGNQQPSPESVRERFRDYPDKEYSDHIGGSASSAMRGMIQSIPYGNVRIDVIPWSWVRILPGILSWNCKREEWRLRVRVPLFQHTLKHRLIGKPSLVSLRKNNMSRYVSGQTHSFSARKHRFESDTGYCQLNMVVVVQRLCMGNCECLGDGSTPFNHPLLVCGLSSGISSTESTKFGWGVRIPHGLLVSEKDEDVGSIPAEETVSRVFSQFNMVKRHQSLKIFDIWT